MSVETYATLIGFGKCVAQQETHDESRIDRTYRRFEPCPLAATAQQPVSTVPVAPAQTPTPGRNAYNINQRKNAQQQRIGNGVKSGQMPAGETSRVEHQERGINREERGMRAQDNGHLTSQDRKTIHHQQNQESRRIYRDKHNARVR